MYWSIQQSSVSVLAWAVVMPGLRQTHTRLDAGDCRPFWSPDCQGMAGIKVVLLAPKMVIKRKIKPVPATDAISTLLAFVGAIASQRRQESSAGIIRRKLKRTARRRALWV
jgi:hypothetical protein